MSDLSTLKQQVAQLTQRLNDITASARKIFQLPWQSILLPGSKLQVSNPENISEFITVQQILDAALSYRQNQLISATISVLGNDVTVDAGAKWIINNVNYELASDFTETVDYAAIGYTRNDILVANDGNIIYRLTGPETEGISPTPNVPINTVLVTTINVTDSTIGYTPPVFEDFEVKSNKQNSLTPDGTGNKYPTVDAVIEGDEETLIAANSYTDSKVVSLYKYKGNVPNYASLPSSGQVVGNVWNALDTDINWAWTGSTWDNLGGTIDISGKEDKTNKTDIVTGNESSTILYLNILGAVTYFQQKLTDSIFGTFLSSLTAKTTIVDADGGVLYDSADGNKAKRFSFANLFTYIKSKTETEISYACSDEVSDLTVGTLITFNMPYAMTLTGVKLSLNTAPTGSKLIVDIKLNGTSIFSTLISADIGSRTSVGAAVPYVISNPNLTDDAIITIITTQVGSTVAGKGLKVTFLGKRT